MRQARAQRGPEVFDQPVVDPPVHAGALQAGGNAAGKFLDAEGLEQEIVGAEFHAGPRRHRVRISGHEDELAGMQAFFPADRLEDGGAVEPRHVDVAENQIRPLAAGDF